jgi:hypothetical protein
LYIIPADLEFYKYPLIGRFIQFSDIFQEMGFFMSPVASYDALALMRQFSENTAAVVAEAQEVLNLSNKKSTLKGDLATDENTRPDKQPRMVHISYSFDVHCPLYVAYDLHSEKALFISRSDFSRIYT